jgi:hypothetical protein
VDEQKPVTFRVSISLRECVDTPGKSISHTVLHTNAAIDFATNFNSFEEAYAAIHAFKAKCDGREPK